MVCLNADLPVPNVTWPPGSRSSSRRAGIPDELHHRLHRGRGDDVVALGHRVQDVALNVGEVDLPSPSGIEPVIRMFWRTSSSDQLAKGGARERHMVARPGRHGLEALDELVVPEVLQQRCLLGHLGRRGEHVEAAVERVGRNVAGLVDQLVGIEPALAQQRDHRPHLAVVDRRGHQDQVADAARPRGRRRTAPPCTPPRQ